MYGITLIEKRTTKKHKLHITTATSKKLQAKKSLETSERQFESTHLSHHLGLIKDMEKGRVK